MLGFDAEHVPVRRLDHPAEHRAIERHKLSRFTLVIATVARICFGFVDHRKRPDVESHKLTDAARRPQPQPVNAEIAIVRDLHLHEHSRPHIDLRLAPVPRVDLIKHRHRLNRDPRLVQHHLFRLFEISPLKLYFDRRSSLSTGRDGSL